ncbi:MAG: VTT domain-containing protein [Verrucomicrobiota bacterium]
MALLLALAAAGWLLWGEAIRGWMLHTMELLRAAGPVVYFSAMALLPMAGFPLSPFTLTAGPVFGPAMGAWPVIACAILAVTVNVSLSYWLAAKALRPVIEWALTRLGKRLPEGPVKSALELTLILRVVPGTPFFVQSYLLGLARVPFWRIYLPISVATPSAYIVAIVLAGDALGRGDRLTLVLAGVLCVAVLLALACLRRRLQRRLRERVPAANAVDGD